MNLNPIMYDTIKDFDDNHTASGTPYAYYSRYINDNYDKQTNTVCIDVKHGIRKYLVRTIMMINNNIELDKVNVVQDCNGKI